MTKKVTKDLALNGLMNLTLTDFYDLHQDILSKPIVDAIIYIKGLL